GWGRRAHRTDQLSIEYHGYERPSAAEVKSMPASFLHGVEVLEVATGPAPITVVKSSVIGLVGTAPCWALPSTAPTPGLNAPTLVGSAQDAVRFGPAVQGY